METFLQFLEEKFLNPGFNPAHERYRELHRQDIHDILRKSYANIGGYGGHKSGSDEESKAIHSDIKNSHMKMVRRDGKISSVVLYKVNKDSHGRKLVAAGTNGTNAGSEDLHSTMREDFKTQADARNVWGEFSGALAHILRKKIKAPVISPRSASELTGKKTKVLGGNKYKRIIGGTVKTKIILGKPKEEDSKTPPSRPKKRIKKK